ncbi:hypothetical protein BJY01DRAFT_205044 [Aspergillus pseudoustus]|uniref:Secreted protein n=1 Tax=Aspergillus pseudoustus TaxID=1810923 RepID=A0ABR4KS94_9EURO
MIHVAVVAVCVFQGCFSREELAGSESRVRRYKKLSVPLPDSIFPLHCRCASGLYKSYLSSLLLLPLTDRRVNLHSF